MGTSEDYNPPHQYQHQPLRQQLHPHTMPHFPHFPGHPGPYSAAPSTSSPTSASPNAISFHDAVSPNHQSMAHAPAGRVYPAASVHANGPSSSSGSPWDKLTPPPSSSGSFGGRCVDVDPTHDCCEPSPTSPSSVSFSGLTYDRTPPPPPQTNASSAAGFAMATPITRFLTKQTLGFIPNKTFAADMGSAPTSPLASGGAPSNPNPAGFRLPSLNAAPLSPGASPSKQRGSFSLPAGEALSRLFGSASLSSNGNSPVPSAPSTPTAGSAAGSSLLIPTRGSTVTLPPLKRACASPTTPLPSLPMSLEDICKPFRYQRSLSCPSDAMARTVNSTQDGNVGTGTTAHQHAPQHVGSRPFAHEHAAWSHENTSRHGEAMPTPTLPSMLHLGTDVPKNRLERSSSVDASTVLAMREAHARARLDHHIDQHPLASLAESAHAMQLLERERQQQQQRHLHDEVDSPRGTEPVVNPFHITVSDQKREKKLCAFPECTSNAVTRGLCISHGGGRRCQRKGCTRGAQSKGLCVAHGGGRICKAKGCSNIQRSMGLCIRHGGGKRCSVSGCQKGVVRQDLCTAHGGKRKCRVDGCNKHVKKKGLCRSHANSVLGAAQSVTSPRDGSTSPELSS